MGFAFAHKLATYLMCLSAFAALGLSDELHPITLLVASAAIGLSWRWDHRDGQSPSGLWWTVGGLAALAITLLLVISGEHLVVAFARFMLFLLVAKLFGRVRSRDYTWIHVLSFGLLAAAAALNGSVSYAVCFLAYVVCSTWSFTMLHLRRAIEDNQLIKHVAGASSEQVDTARILNSRRIVGPAFFGSTAVVSVGIFIASAMFFFMFPRLGFGFFSHKSHSGPTMAGFSDGVQLGEHGLIRSDMTVVMRIFLSDPEYRGANAPALHWRGVAFDKYKNGSWSRSRAAPRTQQYRTRTFNLQNTAEASLTFLPFGDKRNSRRTLASEYEGSLKQEIYLEPLGNSALFGASRPIAFEVKKQRHGGGSVGRNDEVRFSHDSGIRYQVYSNPELPDDPRLRQARDADPQKMAMYLRLPSGLPARIEELARTITRDAIGPHQKAKAVATYLRSEYAYTLDMKSDRSSEPLDYFLFERKMGHCEYFSSAMAILLRYVGVPTRNVNGFLGGEWNTYGNYLAVRGGDAHSWVEVYFEEAGWVTFDPTPAASLSHSPKSAGFLDDLSDMLDNVRLTWFKWVIEYDLARQVDILSNTASWLGVDKRSRKSWSKDLGAWLKRHARELVLTGFVLLSLIVLFTMWRRRRTRTGDTAARRKVPKHAITTLYRKTAHRFARRGFNRSLSSTPREHADSLRKSVVPGAEPFQRLTQLYYAARFDEPGSADVELANLQEAQRLSTLARESLSKARR